MQTRPHLLERTPAGSMAARRGRRHHQSGQAMPLAAVGLFIMSLGVLATLNLGQAVHEKIKLQNTADSAAYSLAAMEARTFNYIAFLNRAQVAHYNTAMVLQSYMTWVGFQVAAAGTSIDILTALEGIVSIGAKICPYVCKLYQAANAIIPTLADMARQMRDSAVDMLDSADDIGHDIVEAMTIFNRDVVWKAQLFRAALMNGHLSTAMMSYIKKNDPDVSFSSGTGALLNLGLNAALNSIEYYQAFDNSSGVNPQALALIKDYTRVTDQGDYTKRKGNAADAHRIMAEICHATRTPRFVSDRSGMAQGSMLAIPFVTLWGNKLGQTKFTEEGEMTGAQISAIGSEEHYPLAQYLSSDDYASGGQGFGQGMSPAMVTYTLNNRLGDAIAAYEEDGKHYLYSGKESSGRHSPAGMQDTLITIPWPPAGGMSATEETDNHARWRGFAPYFTFNAKADRTADFNQPSTWFILNKHHRDFQTGNQQKPWFQRFSWQNGTQTASLDTTIGGSRASYLFEGLNVISRGMAYYHRPGAENSWREQPNFFNPFWRARLAPVGQKLQAFWDRWVTQNITTDSDSAIVQGLVATLRNAQMDLFTSFVTALITH